MTTSPSPNLPNSSPDHIILTHHVSEHTCQCHTTLPLPKL
jgi:hypothetical protein